MTNVDQWMLEQTDARIYRDDPRITRAARKLLEGGITEPNQFEAYGLPIGEVSDEEFAARALPILEDAIWMAIQEKVEHMMDDLSDIVECKIARLLPALIENAANVEADKVAT